MKLILFDIDSTLVRVDRAVIHGLTSSMLAEVLDHHEPLEDYEVHGKTDRQIIRELRELAGAGDDNAADEAVRMERMILDHWRTHLNADTVALLEGVPELLSDLASREEVALGVLTGNLEEGARAKLDIHGLNDYFPFGAFGSDSERRIDLPPIALERARALHGPELSFSRTLIVGDSHRDIECARAWGIRTLAVATGSLDVEELRRHGADAAVATLRDRSFIDSFLLD